MWFTRWEIKIWGAGDCATFTPMVSQELFLAQHSGVTHRGALSHTCLELEVDLGQCITASDLPWVLSLRSQGFGTFLEPDITLRNKNNRPWTSWTCSEDKMKYKTESAENSACHTLNMTNVININKALWGCIFNMTLLTASEEPRKVLQHKRYCNLPSSSLRIAR